MATKPFASAADLAAKEQTLEVLADGVCSLTAEGGPNVRAQSGIERPIIWTAERDRIWALLQS